MCCLVFFRVNLSLKFRDINMDVKGESSLFKICEICHKNLLNVF